MAISHVLIPNQATFPRLLEKILKGNEAKKKEEKKKMGANYREDSESQAENVIQTEDMGGDRRGRGLRPHHEQNQ